MNKLDELTNEIEQGFMQPGGWKACRYLLSKLVNEKDKEFEQWEIFPNDLLAVIHRDGGHHTQEVGEKQSIVDAIQVWVDRQTEIEQLKQKHSNVLDFMDKVRNIARNRNPNGVTILDFMSVWNEQYEDRIKQQQDKINEYEKIIVNIAASVK